LSGNDNIQNEAHYVANNFPIFVLKIDELIVASINISPLSGEGTIFGREEGRKYKI